jgi:hypothetical protein
MITVYTMEQEVRQVLERVLTIIDYKDDKESFINEFITLTMQKALIEYSHLLSVGRRHEFQHILHKRNSHRLKEALEPYIATEEFIHLFQERAQKLFQAYMEAILHQLTEEQKKHLYKYFNSLSDQTSTQSVL